MAQLFKVTKPQIYLDSKLKYKTKKNMNFYDKY